MRMRLLRRDLCPPCTRQSRRIGAACRCSRTIRRAEPTASQRQRQARGGTCMDPRARHLLEHAAGLVQEPACFAGGREVPRDPLRTGGEIAGAARGRAACPESARTGRRLSEARVPRGSLPPQDMGAKGVALAFEAGAAVQSTHLGGLTLHTSGTIVHSPRESRAI